MRAETSGDLLIWGKENLKGAGLDDFDISAEQLLQFVLGLSRSELILNLHNPISPHKAEEYRKLIAKRLSRVPLQYLTGLVEFYNIKLKCDSRALIPRPETEILVETAIAKLKQIQSPKILDIGTGTGNIAIALAKNIGDSFVTSVDISPDALDLAAYNAGLNEVAERMLLKPGDILNNDFIKTLGTFDCVVSNPPYVSLAEKEALQPEVSRYEPEVAVFAGNDPLIFFKTIISKISYILRSEGLLAFEVGFGQAIEVVEFMKSGFRGISINHDLAGLERVVTGIYGGTDKK